MVEVVVGQKGMRGSYAQALGRPDQRLDGSARVDEEGRTPFAVGDEVRVRQELRMGRMLDEHHAILA